MALAGPHARRHRVLSARLHQQLVRLELDPGSGAMLQNTANNRVTAMVGSF